MDYNIEDLLIIKNLLKFFIILLDICGFSKVFLLCGKIIYFNILH